MNFDDCGMGPYLDIGCLLDLVDEVAGHGCRKRVAADQHHHFLRILRKVERGLARRISAANDVNGFALAGDRLLTTASVIDTCALHAVHSRNLELAPLHARRDQDGVAGNLVTIGELQDAVRTFRPELYDFLRSEYLHSEALRLHHRPARKITAAQVSSAQFFRQAQPGSTETSVCHRETKSVATWRRHRRWTQ